MNPLDPKKEHFKWGPIIFNFFYGSIFLETIWRLVPKKGYPWPWPHFVGIATNKRYTFICHDHELRQVGLKYFRRYFLNKKNYQAQWHLWLEWIKDYKKLEQEFSTIKFTSLSDKELLSVFKKFYAFNAKFWLIVHVPEIANWGGEYWLLKKLRKVNKGKAQNYLEILSAPVRYSFFQQEELALLKLANIKDKEKLSRALKKHAHDYRWLLNSYSGNRVLTDKYFAKELKDLLSTGSALKETNRIKNQIKAAKSRKKKLTSKLKLKKEIILAADQLSESIMWQDERKGYIWRMQYWWDIMLKEIAKRSGWQFNDLIWSWPKEIIKIFKGQKVDKRKIISRQRYHALELSSDNIKQYYGQQAKQLIKKYTSTSQVTQITEIKGLTVSKGAAKKVKGLVKIITDPFKQSSKVRKGDILVTGMTSPEYIVLMKKAAAIVTDHGGMTSHAAVVSRELKIPCIVGTKIATQVLKDGDKVEVDAIKGVVRKV